MSSDQIAIRVDGLSKHYLMYERPEDRLKQSIVPRLQRLFGRPPKQYYRDFVALDGVSFDVRRGETVGIVGRNGSGKSTLLQIVCGTLAPTTGTVEVAGRIAALLELGSGFNTEFTGRENVYMNGAILGLSQAEIDDRFDAIAAFADIGDFIEQPLKTYSSGMAVRLAFAVAVCVDPDILVVDEALSVGDEAFQRKCFARIEQIQERGGTILFVSHSAQTVTQLCSRAMLIDGGELLLEGTPKTVVSNYQRLVNLSGEKAHGVREEIRGIDGYATGVEPASPGNAQPKPVGAEEPADTQAQEEDQSWFDPNLVSQSRVEYESRGARIRDVKITNASGEQVNVLEMGQTYSIEYKVDFDKAAQRVAFGLMLKTISGVEFAGIGPSRIREQQVPQVESQQYAEVSFRFRCCLVPGAYFLTTGVSGVVDRERVYLHRIHDALTFRVDAARDHIATGLIDLGFEPEIQLSTRKASAESPAE